MFAINFRQLFTSIFAVLLIACIFSNWAVAPVDKIDPAVLAAAQAGETVAVIIRLQDQPGQEIAQAVQAQFNPNIEAIGRDIRNKIRPFLQQGQPLPLNVEQEVKALQADLENTTQQMRQDIRAQIWNRISGGQQRVREAVENAGGTVHAQLVILNAIGAFLPANAVNPIALLPEVGWIELDDINGKPELSTSVPTINAPSFWNAGYTGGVYDIGVVDKGVDNHNALSFYHTIIKKDSGDASSHGTRVAGIVASGDSTFKGVAFGLDKIVDASFDTLFDTWGDAVEAMEWALTTASDHAEALNHSYGWGSLNQGDSDYTSKGADVDRIIDGYQVVLVKSAGNNGPNQYTLTQPADSYNAIVVAAADEGTQVPVNRSDDIMYYYSSRGPTPLGRKKPDLTAPGVNIFSTDLGGSWSNGTGTSDAAPHVAGALLLGWNHGMTHPALLKAWLINSAEDKGTAGWNNDWGWGYIDLNVSLNQFDFGKIGLNISPGANWWNFGTMNAGERATLAWLKHNGQSLADLDLYLYDAGGSLLASSTSSINNVEQVVLNSGSNRSVYIRVHYYSGSGTETFGLALPRSFQLSSPPPWWTGSAPAAVSAVDKKGDFALYPNYPNPFNPDTWIPYQLATEADVVIRIYNVEGQLVRLLNLGKQPVGTYVGRNKAAHWDGKNNEGSPVASGVYFYTLFANGKQIGTQKMMLQK